MALINGAMELVLMADWLVLRGSLSMALLTCTGSLWHCDLGCVALKRPLDDLTR